MDENKKDNKEEAKTEVKKAENTKVEAKKEEKKPEPKFEKVSKKEADKIEKAEKKGTKKTEKSGNKKTWVPTVAITAVVIAIIAILTAMIVTSSDPKKSVEGLLTNLKAGDFAKAQEYLSGDEASLTDVSTDQEAQKALFSKLAWKVKKVNQESDKATVEVEITNKDFQTVVNNYAKKVVSAAKEAIGNGSTANISEQDFQSYFVDELKNDQIQTTTVTKTINVVKTDKKWKVVSDDALVSAILPGLNDAINQLS